MAFNAKALMGSVGGGHANGPAPTADEIFEAARYLGIDPIGEPQYLWIAEEMLTAPLPDGWTEHTDAEGNVYFYNNSTGESVWDHPLYEFCVNMYDKLKNQGGDQTLNAAQEFYESRLKRKCVKAWYAYLQHKRRKEQKARMVLRYAESNTISSYFERWKQYRAHKIMKRRKEGLVVEYYHQQVITKHLKAWKRHLKDTRSMEKKQRRALAYFANSTVAKCMKCWREYVAKRKYVRKVTMNALQHHSSKLKRKTFSLWRAVKKVLQVQRYKIEQITKRLLHTRAMPAFNAWRAYYEEEKIKKEAAGRAIRHWTYAQLSSSYGAWRAYVVHRRAKRHRLNMITSRWRYRMEGVTFNAWVEVMHMARLKMQRARSHWEMNCLGSLRRRVKAKFTAWKNYALYKRERHKLQRMAVLHAYDVCTWNHFKAWVEYTNFRRVKAEKRRAATIHYYDHLLAKVFWGWRCSVSLARTLAIRRGEKRPWLKYTKDGNKNKKLTKKSRKPSQSISSRVDIEAEAHRAARLAQAQGDTSNSYSSSLRAPPSKHYTVGVQHPFVEDPDLLLKDWSKAEINDDVYLSKFSTENILNNHTKSATTMDNDSEYIAGVIRAIEAFADGRTTERDYIMQGLTKRAKNQGFGSYNMEDVSKRRETLLREDDFTDNSFINQSFGAPQNPVEDTRPEESTDDPYLSMLGHGMESEQVAVPTTTEPPESISPIIYPVKGNAKDNSPSGNSYVSLRSKAESVGSKSSGRKVQKKKKRSNRKRPLSGRRKLTGEALVNRRLKEIFKVYCGLGSNSGGSTFQSQETTHMTAKGWLKLMKNFDVVPTLLKPQLAKRIFNEVASHLDHGSSRSRNALNMEGMVFALRRIASLVLDIGENDDPDNLLPKSMVEHMSLLKENNLYRKKLNGLWKRDPTSTKMNALRYNTPKSTHSVRSISPIRSIKSSVPQSSDDDETAAIRSELIAWKSLNAGKGVIPKLGGDMKKSVHWGMKSNSKTKTSSIKINSNLLPDDWGSEIAHETTKDETTPKHLILENLENELPGHNMLDKNDPEAVWNKRSKALRSALKHERSTRKKKKKTTKKKRNPGKIDTARSADGGMARSKSAATIGGRTRARASEVQENLQNMERKRLEGYISKRAM